VGAAAVDAAAADEGAAGVVADLASADNHQPLKQNRCPHAGSATQWPVLIPLSGECPPVLAHVA
jgi:hypothetical protein